MKVTTLETKNHNHLKQSNLQSSKSTPNSQNFASPKILVVLASDLFDISTLIAGVNREANVLQLDPNQDAIEQITSTLKSNPFTIKSLHLVTHASANILSFGNTNLSLENIDSYRSLLKQWNVPEILLYGCNLAQENTHFIQRLHQLTGANIAASSTPIGCFKKGGNWHLDVKIGQINSEIAFNEEVQNHYQGLLTIERVSINSQGEQAAPDPQDFGSQDGNISNNGQFIAFESNANNLVPDDNNGVSDVFVRDRQTGITSRVSINSFGQEGNDKSGAFSDSILPAITPDGRFVAFESKANNLAPGDNNAEEWDIFVRDRETETTTRVSIRNDGISGDDASRNPVITPDGRFIAFESRAENLVPRDDNSGTWDIFVHDRDFDGNGSFDQGSSRTVRISINGIGLQGNGDSFDPSISSDGQFVVFESDSNNLVVGDNNGVRDIFLYDRDPDGNGTFEQGNSSITRLPIGLGGVEANNASFDPQFSGNDRFIVFESLANNLVEGDSNNALDIFVYDLQTGVTNQVSVDANGVGGNFNSSQPSISNDGRFVGFSSRSSNFVLGDNNGVEDIFVHDRDPDQDGIFDQGNGIITRVSITDTGQEGNADSFQAVVSGDGSLVAFESLANNLIPGDTNGVADVFISTIEPAITILAGTDPIEDGQTNGVFEIRLNQPAPPEGLTVNFSIAGDAINPDDYRFAAGNNITNLTINSFTIAPGATTATLDVIPVFDNISETDETIEVSLQPGTNYALTTSNTASLIIGDRSLIVTNTNDAGVGSLRQVINTANRVEGTDIITFNIPPTDPGFNPNTGTFSIRPTSPLPTVSDVAILDATSQPGYTDKPLIEIDGSNVNTSSGLTITAGNSTVKGFVINQFSEGIRLINGGNNTIQGNYIGTDITGNIDFGNIVDGIFLGDGSRGNLIGGTTPQTRNLISGNGRNGVQIDTTSDNIIQGNYIGTNISGTADLGNSGAGIGIFQEQNNVVGGTVFGAGNLISGNDTNGIELNGNAATNNLIQGNFIGTASDGNTPLGNTQNGILVFNNANNNTIGGVAGSGNIIGFNNQDGVRIDSGEGNAILSNSIFDNGLGLADIGIDLNNDGISINDFGDEDTGANTLQNYPDLLTATLEAESITINGIVDSTPGSTFTVQFFANETLGESDRQGRTFLGETQATSNIPFTVSFDTELAENQRSITATATDANNNTSEFSTPITANTAPVLDLDEDDSSGITGNNYSNRFIEGREAVIVADTDVEIEDADSPNLAFATLTLTNPINGEAESLAVNGLLPTGITATAYNSVTGELQLRGEASVADYQTAISQVVYNNTQLNPDLSDRLINITVNDGSSNSNIAETTISLIGTVQVSIAANLSPVEGETGTFTITLDEPVDQPLIIEFDPDESIATQTEDYTLEAGTGITTVTPNTFIIAPGVTSATLNVVTIDDNIFDPEETIELTLIAGSNYLITENNSAFISIVDNDNAEVLLTPPLEPITTEDGETTTFELVLSSEPIADVIINLENTNPQEGNLSVNTVTFTSENWDIPQVVTVTGVDDNIFDGEIDYSIITTVNSEDINYNNFQLEDITITNQDNDEAEILFTPPSETITTEDGDSVNFEFVLSSEPIADVVINLENTNPDEGILSTETLTFTPENWNNSQIVTVTGVDDDIVDGDVEYSINTTVLSNDLTYDDFDLADINLTNIDNDEGGIVVTPIDGLTTTESGEIATFEIVLTSEPTADVRLDLNSSNPNEGSLSISEVIFTPENWDVSQIVIVTGVDDDIADGDLSYSIITDTTVSNDPIYNGINPADVSLVNADNETPGITVTPVNGLVTSEAEGSDSFEIFLNTEPVDDVTIGIESSNITEGIVSTEAVTFTPENWNIPQMITVTGVDDNIDDDDIAYSIITTPDLTTTDPNYNEFNPPDINVTNTDNDTAEIVITPTTGLTTSEVGGIATFDVFLTSEPLAEVTFNLASSNTAEGILSTETLSFTPQNWELPQTVTITGVDDLIADGNINYSIITGDAVSLDAKYNGFNPDNITVINTDNETPGITVSPTTGLETSEAGETATFQVVLNTQPIDNVTLNLISDNPTEGGVFPPSLIFTPDNWLTPQVVTVTGVDDLNVDGDIEYRIITEAAISNDLNYNNLNPENVTLTNLDNDLPVVDLSVDLTTGEEANTTAITVTATASANVEGEQTVNLDVSGIGITSNDYTLSNPQIIIPDGNNTASVTFRVLDDVVFEGDETATLTLLNPSDGIILGTGTANLTIIDNDTPATVEFSQTDYQINEDGTSVGSEITINRTGDTSKASTVEVELTPETATAGEDFDNFDNNLISVRFAANQKTATVNIPIFEDNLVEEDETFSLALVNPSVETEIGTQDTTTVEIFDNEIPRIDISETELSVTESGITDSYNLVLTTVPPEPVTIRFQTDSQIEPITEVTFDESNWNVPQTIEVQAVDDELVEDRTHNSLITHVVTSDDQTYNGFILEDINIEIAENDVVDVSIAPRNLTVSEDGETDTYSLVLTREPELPVTIEFELNEQQLNSIDAISFDSTNWNTPKTVTVEAIDDVIPEGDETLAISHNIVSEDENYRDLQIRSANVEILDNDVNAEVIIVNNNFNLSLTEGETTASYEIVLSSPPVLPVTIEFNTGNRINSIPAIEFDETNWNIPQTVNIVAINDNILQGDTTEIIRHTVMSADRNYDGLEISDINIDLVDNDVAEVLISQTSNRTEVSEDGLTDTYQVILNSQPTEDVIVTITPDSQVDLGEGAENEIELIFTSENWNEPQTVTVEAVDDEDVEADIHTSTINHTISSNDSNYNRDTPIRIDGRIGDNITVDIIENDEPLPPGEPGISVIQPVRRTDVIEGFGSDVYKIVLNSEPTANVEININSNSQLETDKQTLNFTPSNWKVPQTITVTAVDDNLTEGSSIGSISHTVNSDDSRYDSLDVDQISANISDNDNLGQQNTFSEAAVVSLSELDDTGVGSDFDDILFGNQGNDRVSGEAGFDLIYGQGDVDALSGEVGDDVLFGGQGDDQIQGDAGNDIIYGDKDSDRLWGGEGQDQLLGGFGNDRLIGGLGADTLTGDLGNDAFVIGFGAGGNTIETADVIVDFTNTQDVIELISPLTFEQLNITSNSNGSVIQVQATGEFLAVLPGINSTLLTEQDFV